MEKIVSPDVREFLKEYMLLRTIPTKDGKGTIDAGVAYREAVEKYRPALQGLYRRTFSSHRIDALIYPTVPCVAVPANPESSSAEYFARFTQNTGPASHVGGPTLTVPVGLARTTRLPMSISLDGPENDDRHLLAIGISLEKLFGRMPAPARN